MSKRGAMDNSAHYVDVHVGRRLRELRKKSGVSQDELAHCVDLTFQQVQKYEKGLNRVSCSKLYDFAKFLKTDVGYFFQGLDEEMCAEIKRNYTLSDLADNFESASAENDLSELITAFCSIKNDEVKMHVLAIAKALALV